MHQTAAKIAEANGRVYKEEDIFIDDEDPDYLTFSFISEDVTCVMEFHLLKDVFLLDSVFDYWQLQEPYQGEYCIREDSRLIAKAMGQSELWYCEDWLGLNGGGLDSLNITFDQWLAQVRQRIGSDIPEWHILPQGEFPGYRDGKDYISLHCIFHDTI